MSGKKRPSPAGSVFRGKSNQWWYKLAATSFLIKVALVVGLFFAVKYAADRAADEMAEDNRPAAAESAETE